MEEEKEDPQTQPSQASTASPTPASNQNLIIGLVMGAAVLLLLILVITQQFNKGNDAEDPALAAKKKELAEKEARNEALRLTTLGVKAQDPEALVTQIKSDTEALARLVNASAGDAALLRVTQENAAALGRRNTDLENQLRQYQAAAARVSGLEAELKNAREALAGTVDKGVMDSLRDELALVKNDRDRLQRELNELRAGQADMIDRNTYALLKSERDQLSKDNIELRAENQRLIAELAGAKLFVTKDDLSPRAVALYRELKRLESEDHRARRKTYNQFDQQLNATVGEAISFKTGSANIAIEHEAHIREMAQKAPANTFFLVVGYASPSGDSKTNEELSSQRATRVASMVNYLKKEGQAVQAVYLGEGKRFGPDDAPNQVCEIWQIRP